MAMTSNAITWKIVVPQSGAWLFIAGTASRNSKLRTGMLSNIPTSSDAMNPYGPKAACDRACIGSICRHRP